MVSACIVIEKVDLEDSKKDLKTRLSNGVRLSRQSSHTTHIHFTLLFLSTQIIISSLTLHYRAACGIEVGNYLVVSGGRDDSDDSLATVAKYSQSGLVEYLPSLNQKRDLHACSSFINDGGETV